MSEAPARFSAPWGRLLYGITALGSVVILGAAASSAAAGRPAVAVILLGVLLLCAAGAVTGYRIEGDDLVIERIARDKRVPLRGLSGARHDRDLLRGALRVGNGGLFVFSGFYWSRELGWFRLHGNDILRRAVLLEVGGQRWVVTPGEPDAFVAALRARIGARR